MTQMYAIVSLDLRGDDGSSPLYWGTESDQGWCGPEEADLFTLDEIVTEWLPPRSAWVRMDSPGDWEIVVARPRRCAERGVRGTRCVHERGHYQDCEFAP